MPTEKTKSTCPGSRDLNWSGKGLTVINPKLFHDLRLRARRVKQPNIHFTTSRQAVRTAKASPEVDCRFPVLSVSTFQLQFLNKCFYSLNNELTLKPATISTHP
jgi:hypothetical protein